MKVNFCGILKTPSTPTDNIFIFYKSLLENIYKNTILLNEKGFEYCRVQKLVSSEITLEETKQHSNKKFKPYIKSMSNYSYHLPYIFNSITEYNFNLVENYLIKLAYFIKNQALYNLKICSHLSKDIDNNIKNWNKLFNKVYRETGMDLNYYVCFENCDKGANLEETMKVAKYFNVPLIYDNLHDLINSSRFYDLKDCIEYVARSWYLHNHIPYIHYSSFVDYQGTHGDIIEDDIFDMLNIFKNYCDNLIVVPELKNYEIAMSDFKNRTKDKLDWCSDTSFNY